MSLLLLLTGAPQGGQGIPPEPTPEPEPETAPVARKGGGAGPRPRRRTRAVVYSTAARDEEEMLVLLLE
jgi:hypothetical protein